MPTVAVTDFTFPSLEMRRQSSALSGTEVIHGQCKTTHCSYHWSARPMR